METKQCIKCLEIKEITSFWKNGDNGHKSTCVCCMSEKRKSNKKFYPIDPSITEKKCSKCKKTHLIANFNKDKSRLDGYAKQCNDCRKENNSKLYQFTQEIKKRKSNNYYHANKPAVIKKQRTYNKNRLKTNNIYAMTRRLRNRLWYALKNKNWKKNTNFSDYIGCTFPELINHIEQQFQPGMSWDNRELWHIDHIIPLASAKSDDELYKLCHYSNLRPLWAKDNLSKGTKIESSND